MGAYVVLKVGLTGGIASGKSAVSALFERLGVPVIDTDRLARELVEPGRPALAEIVQRFGPACLTAAGELDRRQLRQRVFADPAARRELEAILHPRIRANATALMASLNAPYCIVVVPLLAESPAFRRLLDRIVMVDVPESVQIERVMARDDADEPQARAILAVQAGRAERLAIADDVIDNTGSLARLEQEVRRLDASYRALSTTRERCPPRLP